MKYDLIPEPDPAPWTFSDPDSVHSDLGGNSATLVN